jgi:integrase
VSARTPSYRIHKSSGQAVVTLDGRDYYLGRYGSVASRAEYDRLISEWLANGRRMPSSAPSDLAVAELIAQYTEFADWYYVKHGERTKEAVNIEIAMRPVNLLYGEKPAREFGPLALKAVRQAYIEADLCRNEVNKRVRHVVRMFRWAVENELVPASVHHGLKAVTGLRRGRTEARESDPVKPVPEAFVDRIEPHVSRQIWAMIQLQRLTGMRPGEVCIMRTSDLDTSGRVWTYTPSTHKTEHHGIERRVYLGPRAQAVLRPWLRTELSAFLFQPQEAEAARLSALRAARKTTVQPSQRNRRVARPEKAPADRYDTDSYGRAITYGCDRANPHPVEADAETRRKSAKSPAERQAIANALATWRKENAKELRAWRKAHRWRPHRLRHNAATWLRKEFGLDVARVILGHSTPVVTEIYAEIDAEKALRAMEQIG